MPALATETAAPETIETHGRVGVLLTNLGTPDSCSTGGLRRYLREFLSDRRVVGLPRILWLPLLHGVILNIRPRKSAKAYAEVWREDGSPLLAFARMQQRKLQERFKDGAVMMELGMRYGNPPIAAALERLRAAGIHKVLVLPLYPQYCSATTASTFDALGPAFARRWHLPALRFVDNYHDHPKYIAALARSVREKSSGGMLVMSFHGIPQSFADAGDPYPAQCKTTARLLAEELKLSDDEWRLSFQSRFGPAQWLLPGTEETLEELAQEGVRSVRVICPGFSADCLETLEEIAMEGRDTFLQAGGREFEYIPCLNDDEAHIDALDEIIRANLGDWLAPA